LFGELTMAAAAEPASQQMSSMRRRATRPLDWKIASP
jgi:hypothetical protein